MIPTSQFSIDDPQFSFSELLLLVNVGRGTAEGYMKRGIVTPSGAGTKGKGNHRGYSGRDVLKFGAVAYLSKAGFAPEWTKDFVGTHYVLHNMDGDGMVSGTNLNFVIDDYAENGEQSVYAERSPFVFHAVQFGGTDPGILQSFNHFGDMAPTLRKVGIVSYVVFDAWVFVQAGFKVIERFLNERSKAKQ